MAQTVVQNADYNLHACYVVYPTIKGHYFIVLGYRAVPGFVFNRLHMNCTVHEGLAQFLLPSSVSS
jgi:hypothetical protein